MYFIILFINLNQDLKLKNAAFYETVNFPGGGLAIFLIGVPSWYVCGLADELYPDDEL